ncbi:MAG: YeeE/YedE family protein [Kofleriaceae bacterium]|nr:YeeE/YedE family protein [Kofleriaceae bacterium]
MSSTWLLALLGGALIGTGSALLYATHGRIAGISGITGALLQRIPDRAWRFAFMAGLLSVGVVTSVVAPSAIGASPRPYIAVVIAGLLVGFGTRLGGGCTSGHGVCGLSRLSARSLVAVVVFIGTGALTAMIAGRLS